jgi:AICAR transformylase/IMP cyclohydrolase PurH
MKAILSVSNKTGLIDFARVLAALGADLKEEYCQVATEAVAAHSDLVSSVRTRNGHIEPRHPINRKGV